MIYSLVPFRYPWGDQLFFFPRGFFWPRPGQPGPGDSWRESTAEKLSREATESALVFCRCAPYCGIRWNSLHHHHHLILTQASGFEPDKQKSGGGREKSKRGGKRGKRLSSGICGPRLSSQLTSHCAEVSFLSGSNSRRAGTAAAWGGGGEEKGGGGGAGEGEGAERRRRGRSWRKRCKRKWWTRRCRLSL